MNQRSISLDTKTILDLQRTAGNRYVVRLLQSRSKRPVEKPAIEPEAEPILIPVAIQPEVDRIRDVDRMPGHWRWLWPVLICILMAAVAGFGILWLFPTLPVAVTIASAVGVGAAAWYSTSFLIERGRHRQL